MVIGPIFDNSSLTFDSSDMIRPFLKGISDQEKKRTAKASSDVFVQRNLLVSTN